LIPATILLYTIIVLFGAPLTTHTAENFLTATHLTLLSIYPLSSPIIPTVENMRRLVTLEYDADVDILKWTYWGAIGALLGAWLGAVPIPLDWDRDWQVYGHLENQAYLNRNGPLQSWLAHMSAMH
jgi:GPI ethanolamine phosphate transferase 2/3 subunit F